MEQLTDLTIEIRNLRYDDYPELKDSMIQCYYTLDKPYWDKEIVRKLIDIFPEGQICLTANGKVVAAALSIIVDYIKFGDNHTYDIITGKETFDTHNDSGDVLYGVDIFVNPDFRGIRLGRRLYDARKELCENLNLRAIIAGGRIVKYAEHAKEMSPRNYIEKVKKKEIFDPTLTFQLANDFHVKKVLKNYLPGDTESLEYATLLEWNNIYYEKKSVVKAAKTVARIGLIQWQMRLYKDFDEMVKTVEYFVDAVSAYQSDFILFPEFFTAPLMQAFDELPGHEAVRELAQFTEPMHRKMSEMAISYNVNIISGSMPEVRAGKLYNISTLFRRDGTSESFDKIHPTPSEKNDWIMSGGNRIKAFDTDCGKIGILICYDVEFPELSRLLADEGMQILFVPFWTDTQNGYMRVRRCAQARAIENECYVAIAGSYGNLPQVNNLDIQYAQSAVFTPSDFAFPVNGIKAEATPNTEMIVIADVDLELLKELHEYGSVQNLKDRRKDVYLLKKK